MSEALLDTDVVVTDYSSIVFEAYLLGIPTVFYVPDLDEYRRSPGLNTDPGKLCPGLCAHNVDELTRLLLDLQHNPSSYPAAQLQAFAAQAFDDPQNDTTAAERLADFIISACTD